MTKFISKLTLLLTMLVTGSIWAATTSVADEVSVKHELVGFEVIRIDEVGIELDVKVGEDFDVKVEGEEDIVENLLLKVRGDKLVIYKDDDKKIWNKRGNNSAHVIISMPKFTGLDLRGAVDAKIEGVDSEEVEFDIKGAGNIEIEGKCGWLIIGLKGAGNIEADDLKCEVVDVDLKGAGNIEVYASEKVDAEISGMGNIDVYGDPQDVTKSDGWFSNISIH